MGLPIPWWPVSLCAVILTFPFKTLRQEEVRHACVNKAILRRQEGGKKTKGWSSVTSGNGSDIQEADRAFKAHPWSRSHQIKSIGYRHLWGGNFQVRKYNHSFPREGVFLDSSSWTQVSLCYRPPGSQWWTVPCTTSLCLCFIHNTSPRALPCLHNRY